MRFFNFLKNSEEAEQAPESEEFSAGAKIKVVMALLVVGFASYVAYWVQEPTPEFKADVLNQPSLTRIALEDSSTQTSQTQTTAQTQTPQTQAATPAGAQVAPQTQAATPAGTQVAPQIQGQMAQASQNSAETQEVSIVNFAFDPPTIQIEKGKTVLWTNKDSVPHTVTGESFSSGTLNPGQTFSFTFTNEDIFDYSCSFHPQMKGVVLVGDGDESDAVESPTKTPANQPQAAGQIQAIGQTQAPSQDSTQVSTQVASNQTPSSEIANVLSDLKPAADTLSPTIESAGAQSFREETYYSTAQAPGFGNVPPPGSAAKNVIKTTRLADSGPEDYLYAGIMAVILYLNRKKLLKKLSL